MIYLSFFYAYLIVGLIFALILWFAAFAKDFNEFIEFTYGEKAPTTKEKWTYILASVPLWPYCLYRIFTNDT